MDQARRIKFTPSPTHTPEMSDMQMTIPISRKEIISLKSGLSTIAFYLRKEDIKNAKQIISDLTDEVDDLLDKMFIKYQGQQEQ